MGVPSGVLVAGEWAGDDLDTWRRAAAAVVATRGRETGEGEEAGVPCSVGPFLYQKGLAMQAGGERPRNFEI